MKAFEPTWFHNVRERQINSNENITHNRSFDSSVGRAAAKIAKRREFDPARGQLLFLVQMIFENIGIVKDSIITLICNLMLHTPHIQITYKVVNEDDYKKLF